jgi:Protein of unknown function (DUF1566)
LTCTPGDYQVIAVPTDAPGAVWCVDKSKVLRTADTAETCIAEGRVPPRPMRATPDQFSKTAPAVAHETQVRGYWIDPADGLMWAARDSGKRGSWHQAMNYCRKLRLAGYSDWRLATIDELESLVNLSAYATEYVGSSDILHRNGDLRRPVPYATSTPSRMTDCSPSCHEPFQPGTNGRAGTHSCRHRAWSKGAAESPHGVCFCVAWTVGRADIYQRPRKVGAGDHTERIVG